MDQAAFCQQLSELAKTEFKTQQAQYKHVYRFKPDTSYLSEVRFKLRADSSISNVRLLLTSPEQNFQALSLRAIENCKFPKPESDKDTDISVTFSAASETLSDIQAKTQIVVPLDRRAHK